MLELHFSLFQPVCSMGRPTLSIIKFSIMTFSITILSLHKTQYNNALPLSKITIVLNVVFYLL